METRKAVLGMSKLIFIRVSETGPLFYRTQKAWNIFASCDKFSGVLLILEDFVVINRKMVF